MANPPKQKGTSFETLMQRYFVRFFPNARRVALSGKNDTGDINGTPLPLELKAITSPKLPEWTKEAAKEAENYGAPFCPVVHKRKGVGDPSKQWVTIEAWMLVELMLAYERNN